MLLKIKVDKKNILRTLKKISKRKEIEFVR